MLRKSDHFPGTNSLRKILAQVLATIPENLLLLNSGFMLALPTIIIPALSGLNPSNNPNEPLTITTVQASWIASLYPIFVIVGSVLTGFLEPLGRKMSITLCCIPYLTGWITLYYYSNSLEIIYIVIGIFGFGSGLMEGPCLVYITETCEPRLRAVFIAVGCSACASGMAIEYLLGNLMSWRDPALIYAVITFGAFSFTFLIPETPQWLLSRDRPAEALKSLQWLRGGVRPDDVRNEFEYLEHHRTVTYVCIECEKQSTVCHHPPPKIIDRFRELVRRKTLIPFVILSSQFIVAAILGSSFRPYFVPVLHEFNSSIDPNVAVPWLGYVGFVGNVLLIFVVRFLGKRKIYLTSVALALIIYFALGIYGFLYHNNSSTAVIMGHNFGYFPALGYVTIHFLNNFGFSSVSILMLSELLPFNSRGFATGLIVAINFLSNSISAKTFYVLKAALTLPGQCIFYGSLGLLQFTMMYLLLPITENRTLEEIEMYFSNKNRPFNDIDIPQISHLKSNENLPL